MNKWIKRVVALTFIVAQFLVIPAVSAGSLEDIQGQKKTVETEVTQVQNNLNEKLSEASEISIALDELAREIEEHKTSITQTEQKVGEQEVVVEQRYEHVADQLKAMQKSEVNHNIVLGLFQAENLTDFINRLYTVSVLTSANEEHLNEAQIEQEKLNSLREELVVHQEELSAKQTKTVQQKEVLDEKLTDLKATLAANQDKLNQLNAEEAEIHAAAAREREAAKAAELAKAEKANEASASNDSNNSSNSSNSSESNTTKAATTTTTSSTNNKSSKSTNSNKASKSSSQSEPAAQTSQAGSWMKFQSTGYSTQQPGLSTQTATGINLLVNPRVIAVDPNQIPLGSLVEVQGMGVYVAGDTGGAIKGKIIDVHFSTVGQALSWGRRSVNIRIIN